MGWSWRAVGGVVALALLVGAGIGYALAPKSDVTAAPSPTHLTSVDGEGTFVIVSTVDIPAGTRLDPLISQGKFVTVEIPRQAVVPDAVIDINQLQGRSTTDRIYQNEQIPLARLGAIP